jgi:hypothetical protein
MVEGINRRRMVEGINHRRMVEGINHRRTVEGINHHLEVARIMEVPRLHRRQPTSLRKQLDYMRLTQVELGTVCTVIPMFG